MGTWAAKGFWGHKNMIWNYTIFSGADNEQQKKNVLKKFFEKFVAEKNCFFIFLEGAL